MATYLRWLAATMACGALIVAAFVAWVDPYNLYGAAARPGINAVKPALTRYQDEIKTHNAIASGAHALIFGNSRAEIGFDPDTLGDAYNLAISGTGMSTAVRQARYLTQRGKAPTDVVIGMEFLDYAEAPRRKAAQVAPLEHPVAGRFWQFDTLFSLASLKDALRTLRIQNDAEAESMSPRGFNPLNEYRTYARVDGYRLIFDRRAQEAARSYVRKATGGFEADEARRDLRAMLDLLARPGSQVHLVVYPYHAQTMALFEAAGLWPWFDAWKDGLIEEAAAARLRHPQARITLHDFSGFGPWQCEPIPARGARGDTRWYWEGGHFKKALGDLVLARVQGREAPAGFGFALDAATRAANGDRIAQERAACWAAQPELFTDARRLIAEASAARRP